MTPRSYQIEGAQFLFDRRCALLADQMRVGKTPQAIMACDRGDFQRILVMCPAIARYQWAQQWRDWSSRDREIIIIEGDGGSFENFKGVAIMSYNRGLTNRAALLAGPKWDVFIPDEAHFAKTPTAQRTSLVYGTKGVGWNSERLWALTGTPAPNHAGEMWALLTAFGIVKASYMDFVNYFCIYDAEKGRFHGNKKKHLAELRALIAPITLRRTLAEVAPHIPRIGYNFYVVKPETAADLNNDDPNQVADQNRIDVAMAKIPTLAEEIAECIRSGEYDQTVVYGYHVDPLKALVSALNKLGIDAATMTGRDSDRKRQNVQDTFKMGVLPVVAAQIIAAGTAIDLSAARHGYFLELDYVPDNNAQAAHRLVNMEKPDPVTFDILTWPGTKDDRVQRRIIRKVETAIFKS